MAAPAPDLSRPTVAVIGAGSFGRNHIRVYSELAAAGRVCLGAIVDPQSSGAPDSPTTLAHRLEASHYPSVQDLLRDHHAGTNPITAASVCVPTAQHRSVSAALLSAGIHVLVEKPIASTLDDADHLIALAGQHSLTLQVGHLERFNPAVTAIVPYLTRPMFFECHRLSIFTPRSLDVDVVLDLMIHDLDIVLQMAQSPVREIRAVGLPVLSRFADIANVRIEFDSGCVANFTASRVSTERVRKLRLFQPGEYISADYARQDAFRILVSPDSSAQQFKDGDLSGLSFSQIPVTQGEPLRLEIEAFLDAVNTGAPSPVPATQSRDALALALSVNQAIDEHGHRAGLR